MTTICYRRKGRILRAVGTVLDFGPGGTVKVKPSRNDWGCIWLSPDELAAGKEKPAPRERKPQEQPRKKRERKPKPAPKPKWQELVEDVRLLEIDHAPDGWPAVKMRTISDLANELEAAHGKLAEFLPLQ